MSYAQTLGDASTRVRCAITAITPPVPLAGVGPVASSGRNGPHQLVMLRVSNLQTLATSGPLVGSSDRFGFVGPQGTIAVASLESYDGITAAVAVDFMGLVGGWSVWVEGAAESYALVSNTFDFQTQSGIPPLYQSSNTGKGHAATRVSAVLVLDASGHEILTGGVSGVTVAGGGTGAPRGTAYPGPGILNWTGGGWQFTPMEAFTIDQLDALFPNVANQPALELDPFGLPLPSAVRPFPVPVFRPDGTPVYSPWWPDRAWHVTNAIPTTALPSAYQTYYPDAPAPAPSVAVTATPVLLAPGNDGQTYTPTPQIDPVTGVDLQPIAPVVEVHDVSNGMPVATTAPAAGVSPILLLAGVGALLYFGTKRGA